MKNQYEDSCCTALKQSFSYFFLHIFLILLCQTDTKKIVNHLFYKHLADDFSKVIQLI